MVRISIGLILGHLCEFILFLFCANTSFYPRKNYIQSTVISFLGYIVLLVVGGFGRAWINLSLFFVINTVLLSTCYSVKFKSAVFYSLILDTLSAIGEYILLYILGFRYENGDLTFTLYQTMTIIMGGKLIYLIGIIFLKKYTNKKCTYDNESQIILALIPLLTVVWLTMTMAAEISNSLFLLMCITVLIINFITFYISSRLNHKNQELRMLQDEYNQNKTELADYQIISEKYENTKIMRHDFHKKLNVLMELIPEENVQAKEYMRQMQIEQSELNYSQYTNNILLAQKVKECHKKGVEMHIHSTSPDMSFISEIDTVAIFSNMIDNALEASENAEKKEIYVDLYTVNNSFTAVKVGNYVEKEPVILDGVLRTQKKNADIHGMGIKSINKALKIYDSNLSVSYDKENKYFEAIALICNPKD